MMNLDDIIKSTQLLKLWEGLSKDHFRTSVKGALLATTGSKLDFFCDALEPDQLHQAIEDICFEHRNASIPEESKKVLEAAFERIVTYLKSTAYDSKRAVFEVPETGISPNVAAVAALVGGRFGPERLVGTPFENIEPLVNAPLAR